MHLTCMLPPQATSHQPPATSGQQQAPSPSPHPPLHANPGRYLVCGADSASLYLEVREVTEHDVICEAKNDAELDGLLTVFHSERSTDEVHNVQVGAGSGHSVAGLDQRRAGSQTWPRPWGRPLWVAGHAGCVAARSVLHPGR